MRSADLAIVLAYLVAVIAAGIACRGRENTVDEYFTARGTFGGRLGTVLIGLSIAATLFSGISLVIFVSAAFQRGAQIAINMLALPTAYVLLRFWFLPRYMAGAWRHPYDVVEHRFGSTVRLVLSAMFFLLRIGWMGVLIYVPTLIILSATGISDIWFWPIVLVLGVSSTIYTVVGGIRGVIVTDAIQLLVILFGMLFVMGFIAVQLDLSPLAAAAELYESGRLRLFDFSLDWQKPLTFWSVLFGLTISNLGSYLADQMCLQRYLASNTRRAAERSFFVNMVGALSIIAVLVLTGLFLSLWYEQHPDPNMPEKADHILAYFIARHLPTGFSGLLIAAILAATMSSMTSGINALAGALTNEWFSRFGQPRTPAQLFSFGRRSSLAIGLAAMMSAGIAAKLGPVLDSSMVLMGAFLGAMLACMCFAVAHLPVRSGGVLAGMVGGVAAGWTVAYSPVAAIWVSPAAFVTAVAIPLLDLVAIRFLWRSMPDPK